MLLGNGHKIFWIAPSLSDWTYVTWEGGQHCDMENNLNTMQFIIHRMDKILSCLVKC